MSALPITKLLIRKPCHEIVVHSIGGYDWTLYLQTTRLFRNDSGIWLFAWSSFGKSGVWSWGSNYCVPRISSHILKLWWVLLNVLWASKMVLQWDRCQGSSCLFPLCLWLSKQLAAWLAPPAHNTHFTFVVKVISLMLYLLDRWLFPSWSPIQLAPKHISFPFKSTAICRFLSGETSSPLQQYFASDTPANRLAGRICSQWIWIYLTHGDTKPFTALSQHKEPIAQAFHGGPLLHTNWQRSPPTTDGCWAEEWSTFLFREEPDILA